MGLMSGQTSTRSDVAQINCEARIKATFKTLIRLADEKNALIGTVMDAEDTPERQATRRRMAEQVRQKWLDKVNSMDHLPRMSDYEGTEKNKWGTVGMGCTVTHYLYMYMRTCCCAYIVSCFLLFASVAPLSNV